MKNSPSQQQVAQAVADLLSVPLDQLGIERCRTGKHNTSWFVTTPEAETVARIAPPDDHSRMLFYERRMMLQEPQIHNRLLRETDVPAPRVLAFAEKHPALERDILVLERLPGQPLSDTPLESASRDFLFEQVGRALRETHQLHGEAFGYDGPHQPMTPQKRWDDAFEIMWNFLLDDIVSCGGYSQKEATPLREAFERRRGAFQHGPPPSLLHMDVWAQNILCDEKGELNGLLDWDRALYGDPEIEFAVCEYCGVTGEAFWRGYGSSPATNSDSRIRRLFYLLYELQKYIFIRIRRRNDPAAAEQYKTQSLALAAPLLRQ